MARVAVEALALRLFAVVVPLALVLVGAASAGPAKTNGLISFGSCCDPTGIYVIKPNGTGQKRIFTPEFDDADLSTAWSPDGQRIAYVAPGGLWTMTSAGKSRQQVTKGSGETSSPTWSADGERIAFGDLAKPGSSKHDLYVINADGSGLLRIASGNAYSPAWSPNGKTIMFERGGLLWTVRPDGKGQKPMRTGGSPAWAPDGSKVAFDLKGDIWTMKANGTSAHRVIRIASSEAGLAWSPDGHWIAYAIGNRGDIRLVHPNGSGGKALTHAPALFHSAPAWQPK